MIKHAASRFLLFSLLSFFAEHSFGAIYQDTYKLEGFEGANVIVRPTSTTYTKYKWGFPDSDNGGNARNGGVEFSRETGHDNSVQSLKATIFALDESISNPYNVQNIFAHYYPYDESKYEYRYIREQESFEGKSGYQTNTYNRLRFWVKVPSTHVQATVKQTNFHFGTYIRNINENRGSAESDNGHYYHYYNLPALDGVWHQIIVDTHPSHQRGTSGSTEHGDMAYPFSGTAYNYFDLMTRFYFQIKTAPNEYPTSYYIDNLELYFDPNPENVDQIYSLHGSYSEPDNTIVVGWVRDKTEDNINHEVRYAFSDIHSIGWDAATPAPDGVITPPGVGGYNGMEYKTNQIDMSDSAKIYIAIKPENSSLFRQIIIPKFSVAAPSPPTHLQVQ
ncbi:MAG: hypothetical protein P8171_17150 [Candidatus Thiodiazotropha sp.]